MRAVFISVLALAVFHGFCQQQPSCFRFSVSQKTKSGSMSLMSTTIDLTINDTLKITAVTNEEGKLQQVDLPPGKYKVSAKYADCETIVANDLSILRGKPTYYGFTFICPSFIKTLSRKEKKKLGIK